MRKKKIISYNSDDAGFTLLELMIVVAIIGILSNIGIMQFQKMQERSRQAEVKIDLAAMYSAEWSVVSDFSSFSTCLFDIGYQPEGQTTYYASGFGSNPGPVCGPTGTQICGATYPAGNQVPCTSPVTIPNLVAGMGYNATACMNAAVGVTTMLGSMLWNSNNVTQSSFTLYAAGQIEPTIKPNLSYPTDLDYWSIDQNKNIVNINNGL